MTAKNKRRVYDALEKMEEITPSIIAMIDTLTKISKEFTDGSGFHGDYMLIQSGGFLLGTASQLESASATMLSRLRESKELIEKQEAKK